MYRIVVTGGRGMVGTELVKKLDEEYPDAEIIVADLNNEIPTDLRYYDTCLKLCAGADEVYHLAGIKGSALMTKERPVDFMSPMLQFDTNMITAAQVQGVKKFLYTSSITVLYPEADIYPSWVKSTAEKLIEAMRIQYPKGTKYCIGRPASIYGKYDDFEDESAMVITSLIRKAFKDEEIEVWGDGSQTRDFINAEDVASALMLIMDKMPQKPINIGSGVNVRIKDVADYIGAYLDKKVKYEGSKSIGAKDRVMDVKELHKLGFEPKYMFIVDGLREVIDYVRPRLYRDVSEK